MAVPPDPRPVVVVGFDGSSASHVALSRAILRVGPYGKLYLVHAWEVPEAWRGRGTYEPYVDRTLTKAEESWNPPSRPTSGSRSSTGSPS
jgi:hypothetical protein